MSTRRLALGAGLVALYLLAVGSLAARAQLWNDELYTWYFAQLPTLGDVWDELSTGVEQIPPFYYVLTRASLGARSATDEVALRIPSMLGFLLACTCLFAVVARRTSAWYGLVAALVPLASGAAPYAWEARPYALVVGFAAAAVLCHQLRADDVHPRLAVVGLALALAGGDGGPLLRRPRRPPDRCSPRRFASSMRRRARLGGRAPRSSRRSSRSPSRLPLIQEARRYCGAFWTEFDLGSAPEFFVFLLRAEVFSSSRIPTWLGIGFATVVLGAALVVLLRRPRFAQTEVGAAVGFLLLPLVGVLVGELVTGAYVERYVLAAVLGPALLVPLALHRDRRRTLGARRSPRRWSSRSGSGCSSSTGTATSAWTSIAASAWSRSWRSTLPPNGMPVAVAHPHDYLELAHYAPSSLAAQARPAERPRAIAPRTRAAARREDGLVVLAGFAPLRIVPYDEQRAPFLLLRTVRGEARDWIDPALADDGARLDVVARDEDDGFSSCASSPRTR